MFLLINEIPKIIVQFLFCKMIALSVNFTLRIPRKLGKQMNRSLLNGNKHKVVKS